MSKSLPSQAFKYSDAHFDELLDNHFFHILLWVDLVKVGKAELVYAYDWGNSQLILVSEKKKDFIYFEESQVYYHPDDVELAWASGKLEFTKWGALRDMAKSSDLTEWIYDTENLAGFERFGLGCLVDSDYFFNLKSDGIPTSKEIGVTVTESGLSRFIALFEESSESGNWDGVAEINPDFKPEYSWSSLTESERVYVVAFLLAGTKSKGDGFKKIAFDFLGCIALHPKTSAAMVKQLKEIKNDQIQLAIKLR